MIGNCASDPIPSTQPVSGQEGGSAFSPANASSCADSHRTGDARLSNSFANRLAGRRGRVVGGRYERKASIRVFRDLRHRPAMHRRERREADREGPGALRHDEGDRHLARRRRILFATQIVLERRRAIHQTIHQSTPAPATVMWSTKPAGTSPRDRSSAGLLKRARVAEAGIGFAIDGLACRLGYRARRRRAGQGGGHLPGSPPLGQQALTREATSGSAKIRPATVRFLTIS
jgi:hypothetical protein